MERYGSVVSADERVSTSKASTSGSAAAWRVSWAADAPERICVTILGRPFTVRRVTTRTGARPAAFTIFAAAACLSGYVIAACHRVVGAGAVVGAVVVDLVGAVVGAVVVDLVGVVVVGAVVIES